MNDYQKYINALKKCAKEHENDRTFTGQIIVSNLCEDTANLLETLEQEPKTGHWIMRHRKVNTINYRTGEDVLTGEIHTVKELIRYETDEPYCAGCGKRAEDISQGYCGYCGAKMD